MQKINEGEQRMKFKQTTIVLLGFILSIIIVSCNTQGTERDFSYDGYENVDIWELSNEASILSLNNYIVFDGGHSIQIINGGCGDLDLKNAFYLAEVSGQETPLVEGETYSYSLSVSVKRSETNYEENPEDIDAPPILLDENFSVIIEQGNDKILDENVEIDQDLTWETKTFTFETRSEDTARLTFRLGCDLELFWIDKIEFSFNEPEPEPVEDEL